MIDINWEEIKEKHPKALNLFELYLKQKGILNAIPKYTYLFCYCDLKEFFKSNKIIINIIFDILDKSYSYVIIQEKSDNKYFITNNLIEKELISYIEEEKQQQAIYKAFSILNDMIKDSKVK